MKVNSFGKTYSFKFSYSPIIEATIHWDRVEQEPVIKKTVMGADVFCVIASLITDHEGRVYGGSVIAEGESLLHPDDSYNKPLGRLIAFKRAVAKIPDRVTRKALWNSFLSAHRFPKRLPWKAHA